MNTSNTHQQLSQIGSQSNLLDFFGIEQQKSHIPNEDINIHKNESSYKAKKKQYFIARKVQPKITKIEEDAEQDYISSTQVIKDNHNEFNSQNRRNSSTIQGTNNEFINIQQQRNSSVHERRSIEQSDLGSYNGLPNLNNLPSLNQSQNSQYVPGYTPQNNSGASQQVQNQRRNYSPHHYGKSQFDKPSGFLNYLNKDQEEILNSNNQLSGVIKSNNLNESAIQPFNFSIIEESQEKLNPQKDRNIFLKHNQPLHQMQIGDNGAKFDKNGNIIPRSIVGKPEWYIKNQSSKLTKEDLSMFNSKKPKFQTSQSISVKSRSLQKANIKNVQKIQQDVKITKFQLEKELNIIRQRIKNNIESEKRIVNGLQTTDKIRYTQQQRNLEKHQEIEKQWLTFIESSCSKLNRDYQQSQLLSQDGYRQKREMTDVFETAKGAFDLFGSRVWYMNLRNPLEDQQKINPDEGDYRDMARAKSTFNMNPLVVLEDIPLAFNKAMPQGMVKRQLEIVRKPIVTNLNETLKMSKSISQYSINQSQITNKPFASFDSLHYYNQRLQNLREDLKFHKKTLIDQNMELDNLAIIGQNQLQREQDMLYNSQLDLFTHQKPDPERYTEEIIEQNYDKSGVQHEGGLKDFSIATINRRNIDLSLISKN